VLPVLQLKPIFGSNLKPICWDIYLDIDTLIEIVILKARATATFTDWLEQQTSHGEHPRV
jgi:hypothetical protein